MEPQDILLKISGGIFSFRVAGVLIRDGKVLLQHPNGDPSYAFPGGHVSFGEASADCLVREYQEETGADVRVERLLWVGETFFPWGANACHQLGLYYQVSLRDESQIPLEGCFLSNIGIEFCWVDLSVLDQFTVYPIPAKEKLLYLSDQVEQFVSRQE